MQIDFRVPHKYDAYHILKLDIKWTSQAFFAKNFFFLFSDEWDDSNGIEPGFS